MLRKCICLLWAVFVVSIIGVAARAEELTGTVQVIPMWCGKPVEGGTVSLHYVGKKTDEGYQLTDGLANWLVKEEELHEEDWILWLLQRSGENGIVSRITETGAEFEGLKDGVYLVEQTETPPGFSAFKPFLLTIPEGTQWNVVRSPAIISLGESPRTGDHPAPIIGAMGIGFSVAVLMVLVDDRKK